MTETIRLNTTPGALYDHAPLSVRVIDGVRLVDRFVQGRYRFVCTARDGNTDAERVVLAGIDGADRGRHIICSLADLAARFVAVQVERPAANEAESPPEKAAGHTSEDWRVGA